MKTLYTNGVFQTERMKTLEEIGTAYLPGVGCVAISKIEKPFQMATWSHFWDMRGVRYNNVENSKIMLWHKTSKP